MRLKQKRKTKSAPEPWWARLKIKIPDNSGVFSGGAYRIRTDDLFHAMEAR